MTNKSAPVLLNDYSNIKFNDPYTNLNTPVLKQVNNISQVNQNNIFGDLKSLKKPELAENKNQNGSKFHNDDKYLNGENRNVPTSDKNEVWKRSHDLLEKL